MNTSRSKGLHLSHQAQAASLFLCLVMVSTVLTHRAAAQTRSAFPISNDDVSADFSNLHLAISDRPPPYSTGRVIGQIALGTASGTAFGVLGGFFGFAISASSCSDDFLCGFGGVLVGSSIGLIGGSAIGVMVAGSTKTTEIGYGRTLLGSAAGFGTGILLLSAINKGDDDNAFIVILVSPAIGATLLGNTSRRYRAGHGPQALLNWNDGQLHLGLPALQQRPLGDVPQTVVRSVRLLEIRW